MNHKGITISKRTGIKRHHRNPVTDEQSRDNTKRISRIAPKTGHGHHGETNSRTKKGTAMSKKISASISAFGLFIAAFCLIGIGSDAKAGTINGIAAKGDITIVDASIINELKAGTRDIAKSSTIEQISKLASIKTGALKSIRIDAASNGRAATLKGIELNCTGKAIEIAQKYFARNIIEGEK